MITTTIAAADLLPWSAEAKTVKNFKTGIIHEVRTAVANSEFWQAWEIDKPGLQKQGVEVFAFRNNLTIIGWLNPPLTTTP